MALGGENYLGPISDLKSQWQQQQVTPAEKSLSEASTTASSSEMMTKMTRKMMRKMMRMMMMMMTMAEKV